MKKYLMTSAFVLSLLSCSTSVVSTQSTSTHLWNYENPNWMDHGHELCGGAIQSPINIDTSEVIKAKLPPLQFSYEAFPINIINNGHSVQVNASKGNIIYKDDLYDLKQFHFHTNSEHKINNNSMPMEVHFVHQNNETNAIVVLAVFVVGGGESNPEFEKYLRSAPDVKLKDFVLEETINPDNMFPHTNEYYTYTGSLTTPPCSQGLSWIIIKKPMKISDNQILRFQSIYSNNTREIQKTGSRLVLETL